MSAKRPHATPTRPAPWWLPLIGLLGYAAVALMALAFVWGAFALLLAMAP